MMKESTKKLENKPQISGEDSKQFFRPESLEKALELKDDYGSELTVLAGGTDLLVAYYEKLFEIESWLDLTKIPILKNIDINDKNIVIGAMVTHQRLANSTELRDILPALSEAAEEVGSPQIRSRGTIGGNICTASPAGDILPPLVAYGAKFILASKEGKREVLATEFFTGPKKSVLKNNELLIAIEIPRPSAETYSFWKKLGRRKALVISSISLAFVVEFDLENRIKKAGLAMGSVAPVPFKLESVEKELVSKKMAELNYTKIAEQVRNTISPIDDLRGTKAYRKDVARDIMINALEKIEEDRR